MEPSTPIFVFTDGLSVHGSLREAAVYHEFRETLRAVDARGQVFEIPPVFGAEPILQPGSSRKELIRKLRGKLAGFAIRRPDLVPMTKWQVKHAPEDEIIALAVRWFSIPEPPPRSLALGWLVTILLSPILVVVIVLSSLLLLSGFVIDGAKRAIGAGRQGK